MRTNTASSCEGRLGALLGGDEVCAEEGDFVAKPRAEWHTFSNPGDTILRLLEIITPGGLEELFKDFGHADDYDPGAHPALAAEDGCLVTSAAPPRLHSGSA